MVVIEEVEADREEEEEREGKCGVALERAESMADLSQRHRKGMSDVSRCSMCFLICDFPCGDISFRLW